MGGGDGLNRELYLSCSSGMGVPSLCSLLLAHQDQGPPQHGPDTMMF